VGKGVEMKKTYGYASNFSVTAFEDRVMSGMPVAFLTAASRILIFTAKPYVILVTLAVPKEFS